MIGVDTNVLVRYLTGDDPLQSARARQIISAAFAAGERVYINHVVACELVWVLGRSFHRTRDEIAGVMQQLLDTDAIEIERADSVQSALERYRSGRGDFADYLIGRANTDAGCTRTVTFDRALRDDVAFDIH